MNETPDWLDSVLQARPVDDEGFGARVAAIGSSRRRTRLIVRLLIGFALALAAGSVFLVGRSGEELVVNSQGSFDGRVWLDAHRQQYREAVAKFDHRPGLRRRLGKDADVVLKEFDWSKCDRNPCDTRFFVGLAGYDTWLRASDGVPTWGLRQAAEQHLRAAIAAGDVDGAVPFVAAATDVEAMGRLILGMNGWGAELFATVASVTDEARVAGRDGGFKPTLTATEAREVRALWTLGDLYLAPAATEDDAAHVTDLQSVLACGAANHVWGFARFAEFVDAATLQRMATSPAAGCRVSKFEPVNLDDACDGSAPICRLSLSVIRLPLWRSRMATLASTLDRYAGTLLLDVSTVTP